MIKLILFTGFLGAGKTTLMKSILEAYKEQKIGVIVNEFGSINIDAELIRQDGIQMSELSNGSIFCACIKDKFVDSLIEMSLKDLEYMFIEASGLADPSNISDILAGIKTKVLNEYDYKGSICVIDGQSFLDLVELLPAIESQLEFCSGVIINKCDLIDENELKEVTEKIEEINPEAEKFITSYCRVEANLLMSCFDNTSVRNKKSRETSNTYESRPSTFIVKGDEDIGFEDLEAFVKQIAQNAYRIKGFANTDKGSIEISAVGKNITMSPWNKKVDKTEIVVISAVGFKMMSCITEALKEYGHGALRI